MQDLKQRNTVLVRLTEDELTILRHYRDLPPEQRHLITEMLTELAADQELIPANVIPLRSPL